MNNTPGVPDGPVSPDNWKRAVYRPPPSKFVVEMLPPIKLGGNFNFQMRICPINRGDRSSVSSRGSHTEYEILRRWEDCLWFQDTLELEYSRLALAKRQRLVAGKGVKKNGMYLQDRASSWESLPPGPEPESVAQNIHALIPRLTKKGTMFRASQATIDQRQAELTAFIEALFQMDVPTLLQDLRRDRLTTDFFGIWRRDQDIKKAVNKTPPKPRSSVTSSVFSTYFSAAGDSPRSRSQTRSSADSSSEDTTTRRSRALSTGSSDSSSYPSSGSARSSISVQITLDDKPVAFGHNPHHGSDNLEPLQEASELARKPSRGGLLAAVAKRVRKSPGEASEGKRSIRSLDDESARPDSRASNTPTINLSHRESWQTTASGATFLDGLNLSLPDESNEDPRLSRMSMASIATFRTEASADAIIPRYYAPEAMNPNPARLSTASFMTDVSADAIIPRSPRRTDSHATLSADNRASVVSDDGSILDEYFYDAFPRPCSYIPAQPQQSRPETPVVQVKSSEEATRSSTPSGSRQTISATQSPGAAPEAPLPAPPLLNGFTPPSVNVVPTPDSPRTPVNSNFLLRQKSVGRARSRSPNGSVVSSSMSVLSDSTMQSTFSDSTCTTTTPSMYSFSTTTTSTASASTLVIKAAHNNSIILLRAEQDLPLDEIRRRLHEKFFLQEGVTLSAAFTLAYMIPASPGRGPVKSRNRSNSLSSTGKLADTALMEMITTDKQWAHLVSSLDGAKLTLRVLESFT
ncbi:hypothetical protein B0H10DRAFT_2008006 [Mycena sp. CBHHK59/15]|nr:hypothetical protein B0H10DRAFT_2008006 [Mycena sp. CBHHK59/15]